MMVRDRTSSSYLIEGVTGRACIIWYLMSRKTAALMRPWGVYIGMIANLKAKALCGLSECIKAVTYSSTYVSATGNLWRRDVQHNC